MNFGLDTSTLQKIKSVFEKSWEIEEVMFYGSKAQGNYREGSDIDLTLKGKKLRHSMLSSIEQNIDELNTPHLFNIANYYLFNSLSLVVPIDRMSKVFYKRKVKA